MLKFITVFAAATVALTGTASGQTATAATAPAAASAPVAATVSPEKQKLIDHVEQLMHVETVGYMMLQKPVEESLRQSRSLLQGRVSAETQDAAMKDINGYAKKFLLDTKPVIEASVKKLIPTTVTPMLAKNFTEDELRQIIAILESPVKAKFESLAPDMEKSLGEKIAADAGSTINPKMTELTQQIGLRMRTAVNPQ